MLRGEKVTLRAIEREDLRLWRFWNDLEVELAGGGDPPLPVSLQRLRRGSIARPGKGLGQDELRHRSRR